MTRNTGSDAEVQQLQGLLAMSRELMQVDNPLAALDDAHPRVILARLWENLRAFNLMQERTYRLSISAGAVQCDPDSDAPLLDYVRRADREMYMHKRRCLH